MVFGERGVSHVLFESYIFHVKISLKSTNKLNNYQKPTCNLSLLQILDAGFLHMHICMIM